MLFLLVFFLLALLYGVIWLVPPIEGLGYLARIAVFHIPVAWVSVLGFAASAFWAVRYLRSSKRLYDIKSATAASLGLGFCIAATVSGAVFARLAWGAYWNWDPRQTSITVLLLIYFAYHALRFSVEHEDTRARVSAVYSLIAVSTVPFLVFIMPRVQFSLHPSPVINQTGRIHMDMSFAIVLAGAVCFFTLMFIYLNRQFVAKQLDVSEADKKALTRKKEAGI